MKATRKVIGAAVGIAAITGTLLAGQESASAQDRVLVNECLDGSAPPASEVGVYNANGTSVTLRCGTPISTGVLHIDDDHPILPGNEFAFLRCTFEVFENGAFLSAGSRPGLVVFQREYAPGQFAEGVYDANSGNDIVTLYTRGSVSNNWNACGGI